MALEIAIIIPANNEAFVLGHTLDIVHKIIADAKLNASVVVVNDGSSDKTSKVAREHGALVVDLERNFGKSFAFFEGLHFAEQLKPEVVVSLDADMRMIYPLGLKELVNKALSASRHGQTRMFVASVYESLGPAEVTHSGIRGFSRPALLSLLKVRKSRFSQENSKASGYGLEDFLNFHFRRKTRIWRQDYFFARPPHKTPRKFDLQTSELLAARRHFRELGEYLAERKSRKRKSLEPKLHSVRHV